MGNFGISPYQGLQVNQCQWLSVCTLDHCFADIYDNLSTGDIYDNSVFVDIYPDQSPTNFNFSFFGLLNCNFGDNKDAVLNNTHKLYLFSLRRGNNILGLANGDAADIPDCSI